MIEEGRTVLTREEIRELLKFEREKEIVNKLDTNKSFEENGHLFQLLKESRFTTVGKTGWLSFYKLPELYKLKIYDELNFLCKVAGTRDKNLRKLEWIIDL